MTAIIQAEKLTKSYGEHRGVIDVDLTVNEGEVFGFLGPNGAGKTTTIRTALDLIRPTSGRVLVFGIESSADPVAIHRRIGYIPGEFTLYDRLTGGQTIQYFANLRGGVDAAYQRSLIDRFDIDPKRRYKELSKGNKQKIGLVIALQHQPELLILDEPIAGLDPLVQQAFHAALLEASAAGRTVLLSSHTLSEVERVAERVAMIRRGKLVVVDSLENLRAIAVQRLEIDFADGAPSPDELEALPAVRSATLEGAHMVVAFEGSPDGLITAIARHEVRALRSRDDDLEEIFLRYYKGAP
jgi:ABC-2 type transport system ATP-binding protein